MRCPRPIALSIPLILWAFYFGVVVSSVASATPEDLVDHGGFVITRQGKTIAQLQADTPFIPASTIKIATALGVLEILGPDHRIKTEFYLRNDSVLCIKGYGDPYLISERIKEITTTLKNLGLSTLTGIVLDNSYFGLEGPADGAANSANPYDAPNLALSVNFNSLPLVKFATGAIGSPEPQTPVLDIAKDVGLFLEPGLHRVNISAFTEKNNTVSSHRYVAELVGELLRREGLTVATTFRLDRIKDSDRLLYTYQSRMTVAEMLRGCLEYSNNFIANQLFLYCGAFRYGPPATWAKGRKAITAALVAGAGLDSKNFTIVEGSGLSRNNRISPKAMIALLEAFRPFASLLNEKAGARLKSGTMTNVFGYAGYLERLDDLDPFVLLLNQKVNNRDQLLEHLRHLHAQEGQ